jgi:arylformamidase
MTAAGAGAGAGRTRYLGYTKDELDGLYETARRVPDVADFVARFEARSAAVRSQYECRLDVAYGEHPRERLDVFPASAGAPALLFFHGGYWRASTKERYSYVAEGVVPLGVTLVVVEYALIPTVTMGELLDQCRRAVAHVHAHGAELGCDPSRLHLSGHSAGGHIVASLMATDWEPRGVPPEAIRGGMSQSGLFELEPIRDCYLNDTLALSDADLAEHSPVRHPPLVHAPLHLSVGGDEGAEFIRQTRVMEAQWASRGMPVQTVVLPGHHHYSIVESLGDPAGELADVLRQQVSSR